MIRLYQNGGGSSEIDLRGRLILEEEWVNLRRSVCQLLRVRKNEMAANTLESIPFEIFDATNFFGDEFSVLYLKVPLEKYIELEELRRNPNSHQAFRQIAETINEVSQHFIRFAAFDLDVDAGPEPVAPPTLGITSDSVERALADAEQLIHSRGAVSGIDRVHTAFHGYLKALANESEIEFDKDANVTKLYRIIRDEHTAFETRGAREGDIERILNSMATIIDTLNPLRNRASIAHPNENVLQEPEAMLFVNSVRTLWHYLEEKLR